MQTRLLWALSALAIGCAGDSAAPANNDGKRAETPAVTDGDQMQKPWPFAETENTATITLKRIVDRTAPILLVSHDIDDGGWQFLDGGTANEDDASIVSLGEILELDPTIRDVADLPLGWIAERTGVGKPWKRRADN